MKNNRTLYYGALLALMLCIPSSGWALGQKLPTIRDSVGRTITIHKPFKRIISLYGAHTENICSLGKEATLIGISQSDAYPPSITHKPRFHAREGAERFLAAQPDLILIRPMHWRAYPALWQILERSGITIAVLQPTGMKSICQYWRALGVLTGSKSQAQTMVTDFLQQIRKLELAINHIPQENRPRVFFESIHRKLSTFSPDSLSLSALSIAGGVNVAQDAEAHHGTNIANYGAERILAKGATIDVYIAQVGTMNATSVQDICQKPGFAMIKAVRNGQVYTVDETIVSRPTLRLLQGIRTIRSLLNLQGHNE